MNSPIAPSIITTLSQQAGKKWNNTDELIVDYILASINSFDHLTITQLAQALNISTSPISSLANKLGYKGYSQFKYALLNLYNQVDQSLLMKQKISHPTFLLHKLQQIVNHNLDNLTQNLDTAKLQLLIDAINQASITTILSVGFSKLTGDYLASKLALIGKDVRSIDPGFALELYDQLIPRSDLLIVISQSGNTQALEKKIIKAHQHHKKIILLTAQRHSYLAKHVDLTIHLHSLAHTVDATLYNSFQINAIFLCDLITLLVK